MGGGGFAGFGFGAGGVLGILAVGVDLRLGRHFDFSWLEIKKAPVTTAGQGAFLNFRYGRVNSSRKP